MQIRPAPPVGFPLLAVMVILIALALACVSPGRYDTVVAERDDLAQDKQQLQKELAALRTRIGNVNEQVVAQGRRMNHMERAYQGLVLALDAEISRKVVEVAVMKYGVRVKIRQDVLFETGSTDVGDQGREVLGEVAEELVDLPFQVVVGGHTDNVPIGAGLRNRFNSNWELAGARAADVVELLQAQGVAPVRLRALSFGDTLPVASNDTPEGRAENRRIEILLRPVTPEEDAAETTM